MECRFERGVAGLSKSNLVTVGSLKERRQIIKVDHMPVSILNSPAALFGGLEIYRKATLWNAYTGIRSRNVKSSHYLNIEHQLHFQTD